MNTHIPYPQPSIMTLSVPRGMSDEHVELIKTHVATLATAFKMPVAIHRPYGVTFESWTVYPHRTMEGE